MRAALAALLVLAPVVAQSPVFWSPPPAEGRLELADTPGGWTTEGREELKVRIDLASDPRPRRPPGMDWWAFREEEWKAREAAVLERVKALMPGEPAAHWPLLKLLDWASDPPEGTVLPPARPGEVAFLARYAEARAQVERDLRQAEAARRRTLLYWFNGFPGEQVLEVNEDRRLDLAPRAGENRLEVLDPATGQRSACTWWQEGRQGPRLQVFAKDYEVFEVLEPGGSLSRPTGRYQRPAPAPGTYTLIWAGYEATSHRWWRPEEAAPREVAVDVLIDGGTDRERHLTFRCLCLPGAGERTLGTFDVED